MYKRLFDISFSAVMLASILPLCLAVAVAIAIKLGWPIFFVQTRPGKEMKPFRLIKFRTMLISRDEKGNLLPDDQRMTSFGRFLRRSSLDELPELWNVLIGDMSLVGPRPLLMEYLPLYSPEQARRHEMRPGITGWAQVNGRNAVDWDERLAMDVWYVDNRSFSLDLKILWLTVLTVCRSEGITQDGHVTMERFRGSKK